MAAKKIDGKWQKDYLDLFSIANPDCGYEPRIEPASTGWYNFFQGDGLPSRVRKAQIISWTETLRRKVHSAASYSPEPSL